jgi:hypothetical protein
LYFFHSKKGNTIEKYCFGQLIIKEICFPMAAPRQMRWGSI